MQFSDLSLDQIILIIIVIFLLFQLRQRKFHLIRSMIVPGLMLVVTFFFVNMEMQGPLFNTIVLLGGGILGVFLGMIIARLTKLKIGKDGSLLMRGSFIAMGLWFLIIISKLYGQNYLNQLGLTSSLILSLFLMLSVSTMISERIFIYYRYLRNRKKWRERRK
ncbi:MAG: hypothetical protein LUQ24_02720 [Methanobacterium sp.]|nr:hypothetical protein [Methanobacterium sp.]